MYLISQYFVVLSSENHALNIVDVVLTWCPLIRIKMEFLLSGLVYTHLSILFVSVCLLWVHTLVTPVMCALRYNLTL